ncbi:hypothetical protein TGAM01_v205240 [Trichoderma gamsii]|uniref:Ring finger domain-containing protein n=1 Tax=Trichoderma gamsii TaxID=398673 RepID=A0A2P4ZNC8_9HYPO|nr:hypothetical protein TGAM01_v205240 [Trichoderma gamsii]PON25802.1 hypothetical protein TGAM01_v205240 [Trichoderma gamsii]
MASSTSITGLFSRLSLLSRNTTSTATATAAMTSTSTSRLFSTTSSSLARKAPPPAGGSAPKAVRRNRQAPKSENFFRIRTLRRNMFSPAPPPLRMARLRYLRHWTIHRAWQLFRRKQHEAIDKERSRMHAGMYNACEELRKTVGPGSRGEGYLYRVAMEKKGVYGLDGVPIEYARFQTDSPAKEAWNHEWKR